MNTKNYMSTLNYTTSTIQFKSSNDILEYLKTHPDYIHFPAPMLDAIVATIVAGLLLAGGIIIAICTAGAASPLVVGAIELTCSVLVSSGFSGL